MFFDLDTALLNTYGDQEGAAWNHHYDDTGYHPQMCFNGLNGDLLRIQLRKGTQYCCTDVTEFMEPLFKEFTESYPFTNIIVRGDSGYATTDLYEQLRHGFELDKRHVRPNNRIATIVVLEATLGLRLCDILDLRMDSFIRDGGRYRLDIVEKKTKKLRVFTVPLDVYSYIQDYALENEIGYNAKLFDISERQVQRHLNLAIKKMELPLRSYGSHSARKYFATKVYVDSGYNVSLVQKLLQHSSPAVTQRYIGISQRDIEEALENTKSHLI